MSSLIAPAGVLHSVRCWLTTVACVLATPANAFEANIQVFTDRHHSVMAPAGVRVFHLDAADHIEAELAADLPNASKDATTIVQQRLQDGGTEFQQRMTAAYQGVVDAWSLGITRIPAVVVDGQYVVYGEPDVSRALTTIETFRRTQP